MARPHKAGIDYFPLDTSFNDQVELLKLEFGSWVSQSEPSGVNRPSIQLLMNAVAKAGLP